MIRIMSERQRKLRLRTFEPYRRGSLVETTVRQSLFNKLVNQPQWPIKHFLQTDNLVIKYANWNQLELAK